ncbi:Ig-like domain-containing protein [Obesumbacterium proteus]|nr:Ig-like domain-containing protein [Obesumbacterium proteus]
MEETILGLQSVVDNSIVDNNANKTSPPSEPQRSPEKQSTPASTPTPGFQSLFPSPTAPVDSSQSEATPTDSTPALPSLGSNNTASSESESAPAAESIITGNAMQAGQILSSENITNSSINYAKSVGEGLINQQINDWLNQKGTARVSVTSDSKISGDMLLPVIGNNDSLLFTQLGMHGNEDRNTANLGLGYRQYIGDWMYGINTFYDYDYTGKNARLGAGGEAWTDYLKLAVNGYYGLTGWHQSHLSDMKDYDERPANGFDLRAEAYLPSYPQLGANIKYEQYFGKDIDLGTGTDPDDLKDNPKALTVGLNYTPVPLITLKGEHSVGDKNESLIGLDVTYRFGVPWEQQISTDSVDSLRSLMGSMYEFVDRNYEIVMQYRKQDLLHISLPDNVNAKAAETIVLPLTVTKAKYGLKDVDWSASPEFTANGGTFRKLSLTQLEVKLPAYVYNQRANAAQKYIIKAVGVDNNGNNSNTAATTINVAPSKNVISELIITPTGSLPANNADYFTVTAIVVNEQGQPMVAEAIKFNIDDLKGNDGQSAATLFKDGDSNSQVLTANTDSQGKATIYVRSKLAKEGTITATMTNGNNMSGRVSFVADTASAQISTLEIINNKALADGQSTNKLKVTVKDGNGNTLPNSTVELSASHGAILVGGSTVVTDAEGQATFLVTNLTVGDSTITARINGSSKTQVVTFVADKSTSTITQGDLTATQDAVANGVATNLITAKITDANANTVAGVNVSFTVSDGARITTVRGVTGDDGIATATVTSLKVGTYTVTARIQESGHTAQTTTRFIPDNSTAIIVDSNMTINPNGALANGVDIDAVEVIVTDANANLLPNTTVSFAVASGAAITTLVGTTGSDGKAKAKVTSNIAGKFKVTATVSGRSTAKDAVFVADGSTATITNGSLRVTADNALANGTAMNSVQAKVTDSHGNRVPNVTVNFTANHSALVTVASAVTDADGLATTTLTNTVAGNAIVTATINGHSQNVNTNFTPDSSTATITQSDLRVTHNDAKADGHDTNTVQAKVTDTNGNVVPNAIIRFSATNGATVAAASVTTDEQGLASTTLTNIHSGTSAVTATINGHSPRVNTNFVADASTATITEANLTVTIDNAKADGHATDTVLAKVTDANGNIVPNTDVIFTANHGAMITTTSATTNADGLATTTLSNTLTGVAKVTATINDHSQSIDTHFVADSGTATIASGALTVTADNAKANGSATNAVQAKVTDASGNVVPNVIVSFSATHGATVNTTSALTNDQGIASTTLLSQTAGVSKVTATINNTHQSVDTTFIADTSTATITSSALTVTTDNAKADGDETNAVQAKVTDASGNVVPNVAVSFTANNGATVISSTVTTNAQGLASTSLTSLTAGVSKVTATINNHSQSVNTTFTADSGTATLISGALTVVVNNAKANGTATNKVQAKVTDANGNIVPNVAVSFMANNGAIIVASATTNSQGLATTTLTNIRTGISKVTATINGQNQSVDTTFVPDSGTATLISGALTVTVDNAKANGTATNAVQAKVTDANGNIVPNVVVSFTANNGATIVTASATTNAQGLASTTLTSLTAGISKVTATVNGHSQSVNTTFAADTSTATIINGALTVTADNAKANGSATNKVQAKITDANGNVVPNIAVAFTANNSATVTTASATTNAQGIATTSVTSLKAGISKVTATINGHAQNVNVTFVSDDGTATIASGALTVTVDNAKANGTATNAVEAKITDANGNVLSNVVVRFAATNGASIAIASATTNSQGIASTTLTSIKAGISKVTATINGHSQSVDTTFVPDSSTATIITGALTVTTDNAKANGTATNAVQAKVTDANGNVLPNIVVSFTANNGAAIVTASSTTNAQGLASTTLTNTKAGISKVTATVNGHSQSVNTTFVADSATATITRANLIVTSDYAKSDGHATNAVQAKVTDANGNVVPNAAVSFTADNGATVITASASSDAQGLATTTLTNLTAGVSKVTATINGQSQTVNTTFAADDGTATIIDGALTITADNAKANGAATNAVQAKVTDAYGNIVPNVTVNFSAINGATVTTASSITNAQGIASTTLTSRTAGLSKVTAAINGNRQNVNVTFVADSSTATITSGSLAVTVNNAKANGSASNAVQAKVTDSNGNMVPNVAVSFAATNGATLTSISVTTDSQGIANTSLTNTKAGISKVTATINGHSQSVDTNFVADSGTATVIDGALTVTADNAKANGTATNAVQAKVTDANGNLIPDVAVSFSATNGATITRASVTTNAQGIASTTLTNIKSGVSKVTATINEHSQAVDTTFVADSTTTTITSGALTVTANNAKANGTATNAVQAKVTDVNGNLVPNVAVSFTATNGATVTTASATTNAQGIATTTLSNLTAGISKVTATINDHSQTVDTTFVADSGTATIIAGALTVTADNAKADGVATNAVQAKITDASGNLVPNMTVSFSATNGARVTTASATTNDQGIATTTLTDITAGISKVTATVSGHSQTVNTTFVADGGTATIIAGALMVVANNAIANGVAMNTVQAKVTDANGNLVPNVVVSFTANNDATIIAASGTTNAQGVASTNLANNKAGITKVTATINGHSQTVDTTFVADASTATLLSGSLTVTADNAKANNVATNSVQAKVTDANGNVVPNVSIRFVGSGPGCSACLTNSTTTNEQGVASFAFHRDLAGVVTITATANGHSQTVNTTFIADSSTASVSVVLVDDGARANGTAANRVRAIVADVNHNVVPNMVVNFTATNGARVITASATTDVNGLAYTTLTNTTAGISTVTATISGSSSTIATHFVGDSATATITSGALTVTADNAKANGSARNEVQVKITDANGNPVPSIYVTFQAANGATMYSNSMTNDQGIISGYLVNRTAGVTKVTATVNNHSQTVDTTFVADSSTATLLNGALTVTADNAKANGTATNAVQAKVTDANGNLVPNVAVSFTANNGATIIASATTNAQGVATTTLTSKVAGISKVTATINGHSQSVDTTFVADASTANILSGALTVTADNAKANGIATNTVQAKVTDANGNLVPNAIVSFVGTNGAAIVNTSAVTNTQGIASTTLTNIKTGVSKVTATINAHSQSVDTNFVADSGTATLISGALTVTVNNAKANGTDKNTVQAKVTDANGNLVPNAAVSFTANNGATIVATPVSTNAQGLAITTLTNIKAGVTKVTATINGHSQTVDTTFIADSSTSTLVSGNLTVTVNNAKANGVATNTVQAKVTDANGNLVPNVTVSFTAANGARITTASATTNTQGLATTTLTNITAGISKVTATVNGHSQSVDTTFVADSGTATVASGALTVTANNAKANALATNAVQAKITDANGNVVPNVTVSFTADNGATVTTASATTNAQGIATTTLTSITAGISKVTAAINGHSQTVNTTFIADATTANVSTVTLNDAVIEKIANATDNFTFTALVKDVHGNVVPNTVVTWSQNKGAAVTLPATSTTDANGKATIILTSTKTETLQIQVMAAVGSGTKVNADKKVSFRKQLVNVHGVTKNAINNAMIPNAKIEISLTPNNSNPEFTVTSGSDGKYAISIPQGSYYLKVTANGFSPYETTLDIQAVTDQQKDFVLSPYLDGKAARIVLTWAESPSDLDSHLWVPKVGNPSSFYEVYYRDRTPSGADANLDVDQTSGFGPETTTVTTMHPGVYCYVVDRYSGSPKTYTGAKVKLYLSDGSTKEFKIEDATGSTSNMKNWTVFKIDTTAGQTDVKTINTLSTNTEGECN